MQGKLSTILKSCIYINRNRIADFKIDKFINIYENSIIGKRTKRALLVTKEKEEIQACILSVIGSKTYLDDLKNPEKKILDDLEVGQLVMYNNKKYKYLGCEIFNGAHYKGERVIILEAKGGNMKVLEKKASKITKYFGDSDMLNKMESYLSDKQTGKLLISKLLKEDLENLDGVISQQIIVVFKSKKYMYELINNTKIKIENEYYDFTRVFPSRYHSEINNYIDLKGNKLHIKPIFLFTSSIEVADQLIEENPNCRKLILLEDSTYCNNMDVTLDYLLTEDQLDKVIIHNTYDSIYSAQKLIQQDVEVYAFENNTDNIYDNLSMNILVQSIEINALLIEIRESLIELIKCDINIIEEWEFLHSAFKALKNLQSICIPIKYCKDTDIILNPIKNIKEIREKNHIYESKYNNLTTITNNFETLYNILYNYNPKLEILKSASDKRTIVVSGYEFELDYFKKNKIINYKDIILYKNIRYSSYFNKKLIFTTFYNNKLINQFNLNNDNKIKNILYYTEAIKYNLIARDLNGKLKSIYENNKLVITSTNKFVGSINFNISELKSYDKFELECEINEFGDIDEMEKEEVIHNFIEENFTDYYELVLIDKKEELLNMNFEEVSCKYYDSDYYDNKNKAYKKILFDNGQFTYSTKYFKMFCIDFYGKYQIKNIDQLRIGEQVIFSNRKTDKDLNEMFGEIINSHIFKEKYSKDYKNVSHFKEVLKEYAKRYDDDYELISQELRHFNINKVPTAIKSWTEQRIVGPREEEVYKIIGKITHDKRLLNNWEDIYNSFEIIRSFRSKFKSIFKYTIRSEVVNSYENDEITKLILETFDNLRSYIDIVTVSEIIELENIEESAELNYLLGEACSLQGGV